jgi:hypothetical protein
MALVAFFAEPELFAAGDARARWLLHNSWGICLAETLFGPVVEVAGGKLVSVTAGGEDLVQARLGFIPSVAAVLAQIGLRLWMRGADVPAALRARTEDERAALARTPSQFFAAARRQPT